jgi:hypothetical protein
MMDNKGSRDERETQIMKFARVGPVGAERPAVLEGAQRYRDLSSVGLGEQEQQVVPPCKTHGLNLRHDVLPAPATTRPPEPAARSLEAAIGHA